MKNSLLLRLGTTALRMELFLARYGLGVLLVFALIYYALYYDRGLFLTGEQGSNALLAMRILAGEQPFHDMFLGYNLLWFYPLVGLFKLLGPHWLAMRIYFLLMATGTGLLGYSLVRRVTGWAWLSMIVGVFIILMPGAIFRNYLGFIGLLGATLLVRGYVLPAGGPLRQMAWMAAAGAGLGVCFLIRIEPSLLMAVVWAGLVLLYPLGVPREFLRRLRTVTWGTLAALLAFVAVHAPFVIHSYQRGFGDQFINQYTDFVGLYQRELTAEVTDWFGAEISPTQVAVPLPVEVSSDASSGEPQLVDEVAPQEEKKEVLGTRQGRRTMPALSRIFIPGGIYFHAAGLWFPLLVAPLLVFSGVALLLAALLRSDPRKKEEALLVLTTTGCALSFFPQYFFFRPDTVHLNEFMVTFWPAMACSAWAILECGRRSPVRWVTGWSYFMAVLVTLQMIVSFNALFGRAGSGSINSGRGMNAPFHALNGVNAKVKPEDLADWEGLRHAVLSHSSPDDFVITYPYVPLVNVMCDRPTYQWSLYVDNATVSSSFFEQEIALIKERRPAVIVINNRRINKTEFSRFRNWAAPLQGQIRADYELVGTFFDEAIEVYVLPEKATEPPRPSGG